MAFSKSPCETLPGNSAECSNERAAYQQRSRYWRIIGPGDQESHTIIGEHSLPRDRLQLRKLKFAVAALIALAAAHATSGYAKDSANASLQPELSLAHTLTLAHQGSTDAQYALARMYDRGANVDQDYDEAHWWLRQAARGGHSAAQNDLGVIYGNGYVRPRDYVGAYMWLEISAQNGNAIAGQNLTAFRNRLTDAEISAARELARDWVNWRTA